MAYIHNPRTEAFFNLVVDKYNKALQGIPGRAFSAIMEGPPGSGKTHLVREVAAFCNAPLYKMTGFGIVKASQAFYTYDTRKMHAGEGMFQQTQLAKAVRASWDGPVMFLMDELDKAYDLDGALLQLLDDQDQYFTDPYGELVYAKKGNLFFFATSNGRRPILPELKRRGVTPPFPAPDFKQFKAICEYQIARDAMQVAPGLLNYAIKIAIGLREVIKDQEFWPVPDEVTRFCDTATTAFRNDPSVSTDVLQWLFRINVGKGVSERRWEEYIGHLTKTYGRVGKALKTELS